MTEHARFRTSLAHLMHYSLTFGHNHAWEDFLVLQFLCVLNVLSKAEL